MLKRVYPINDTQDENIMSQSYSISCNAENPHIHDLLKGDYFNVNIKKKYMGNAFAMLSSDFSNLLFSFSRVIL